MATYYKNIKTDYMSPDDIANRKILDRAGQLLANPREINVPQDLYPKLISGQISLEEFENALTAIPDADRNPQFNTGSGFKPYTGQNLNPVPANQTIQNQTGSGGKISEQDYQLRPGETIPQYNARIANLRAGAGGTATPSGQGTTNQRVDITQPVDPKSVEFKSTSYYKALPKDMQDFVDLAFNVVQVGGEEEARMFTEAIKTAKGIADPYYKTQLTLASAEVLSAVAEKTSDYNFKKEAIERARDEIIEDVSINKDFLTLEQQAELAREARNYDQDLLAIADQAAEKGITFATGYRSRAEADRRRAEQYQDVIQSSRRKLNIQNKEWDLKARRGDMEARKKLEELNTNKSFDLQSIGRNAEQVLGSANLPTVEGYTPIGGVTGKIEEEKSKSILSDVSGFMSLQKGLV